MPGASSSQAGSDQGPAGSRAVTMKLPPLSILVQAT
jgi:hypothetical protein